ncbi:hypothetical protein ETB97_001580 [Aspergillus alliaceus]|uniref:Myb-like domain-containing protein n=1 Tax=Petromyces alliaceus TaxID=209559 RepID=A0A8H6ACL7_PETAA|nr:hypothetical protein ETB97_001580 [Aspergillus burnettii]
MNRQISYSGPLATSSFPVRKPQFDTVPFPRTFSPCNFSSSLPSGPLNHPLPQKPRTSKYFFHAYTPPDRDLVIPPDSTTSQHNNHGECVPVNDEPEFPSDHQIGLLGSPIAEYIISLPSEDTTQGLGGDCEVTSSFNVDIADPPTRYLLACAESRSMRAMRVKVESARSNPTNRKRPAVAALETDEKASDPRRARVRAEASEASEASSTLPTPRSARPYSAAEDKVLQKLVARGLAWDEVEKEF